MQVSRARAVSWLSFAVDRSRTERQNARRNVYMYCARRKMSITSHDTLLHLRLFSHLPHYLVADAPRSTRRQAPFRHRYNAMHNCSSQKECINSSTNRLMQLVSLILKNYCGKRAFVKRQLCYKKSFFFSSAYIVKKMWSRLFIFHIKINVCL